MIAATVCGGGVDARRVTLIKGDMVHILRSAGAIALMTAVLAAVPAAAASAAKLVIRSASGGEVLKPGAAVGVAVFLSKSEGECIVTGEYELATNSAATDKLKNRKTSRMECERPGFSVSGAIKEVKLSAKGVQTFKMSPKLALNARGCVYEFASFTGHFATPFEFFAFSEISATGKLNKKASSGGCATTLMETVDLYSAMYSYGEVI